MNYSVYNIRLDLHKSASQASLITPKHDTKRKIVITLTENNKPYAIAEGCYAVFTAKKADGKVIYNDCVIEDNRVVYAFTEQTAAAEGVMNCQIELYGTDSELISSPSFVLTVFPKVYDGEEEIESTNEFTALQKLITEVNDMLNDGALRGDDGVSVTGAVVSEEGELKLTLSDGNEITAGFVKGEKGDTGDPGPQGLKGDKGDKGETGPEGPQGIQGIQGIQGEVGPKGDTGPQGERGLQGEQGIQGIQGIPGETGPKGDTGPQGEQGIKGDTGDAGPKGEPGVVISSEEPTDPNVSVWIDPEGEPESDTIDPEAIKNAISEYLEENPIKETDPSVPDWAKEAEKPKYNADEVGAVSIDKLGEAVDDALAEAKASGMFDGKDGQDGQDGENGYTPRKGVDYFDGKDGVDGQDGKDGVNGTDGVSVTSVVQTTTSSADGGENVVTVTLSNGAKSTFKVKNGSRGSDGAAGKNGTDGEDGEDGNGIASAVLNADYTLTLTFTDGTSYTTPSIRGAAGKDGSNGTNGTSVTVSNVSESSASGGTSTVTFSDGKTLNVKNGKDGSDGVDGYTPVKGTDYFTADDIQLISAQATASLNYETWTFELEDGTTVTKKVVLGEESAPT